MMRHQAGCDGMKMTDWKISPCRLLPCNSVQGTAETAGTAGKTALCFVVNILEAAYHAAHSNKSLPKVGVDYHRAVRKACSGSDLR